VGDLPDSIWQSYGMQPPGAPPPIDADLAGLQADTGGYGDVHPVVAQAFGLAPPPPAVIGPPGDVIGPDGTPAAAPLPPQIPLALPSAATAGAAPAAASTDIHIPMTQFGHPGGAAAPAGPAPTGKPPTPAQLEADARARQATAEQAATKGIQAQEQVSIDQSQQNLAAFQQHADAAKQIEDQRKALNDEIDKTRLQKMAYVDDTMKEVDNFRIDQDKFVHDMGLGDHIGWGIATALGAVGQALQRQSGPNPIVQQLQDRMHQAVVAQMDQREQLKEKGARAEHSLDRYNAYSTNRQAQMDLLDARNDRWLAQQIALTGAKMGDPQARATAQQQYATLMESSADKAQKSADTAVSHDVQYKQVAIAQSANAIAGGHLAVAKAAEARAQKLQDLEWGPGGIKEQELGIKAAEEQRKAMKDQQQKVKEEGIGNPITGDPLLTERGRGLMTQADQLEAVARKDPAQAASAYVQKLRGQAATPQAKAQVDQIEQRIKTDPTVAQDVAAGYAAQLRSEANTTEVATIPDPVARREVQDGIKWGQDLINTTAKIKSFLTKDPDIKDREGWGRLQSEYGTAMVEYARAIGARASSRELDAISKHIMTYDPSSLIDRAFRKAPGIAALDGLQDAVKGGVDSLLKSHRIKDGWVPSSPSDQPAATFDDKTAVEFGDARRPNVNIPGLGYREQKMNEDADASSSIAATGTNYGLSPKIEAQTNALITEAGSASNAKRKQIVASLAAPIVANDRPSLSWGLLRLVHDQDPAMFEDILKEVGPERAKDIRAFVPATAIPVPAGGLTPSKQSPEAAAAWQRQVSGE
jgi:hypothetical protein